MMGSDFLYRHVYCQMATNPSRPLSECPCMYNTALEALQISVCGVLRMVALP